MGEDTRGREGDDRGRRNPGRWRPMRAIESNKTPDRANSMYEGGERAGARRDEALNLPEFIQAQSRSNAPMTQNRAKPLHQQL